MHSQTLFEFDQGEREESQQGEHYNNQCYRVQNRKREFWWLQKKESVRLNWSAWSPGKPVDRVCSLVLSVQDVRLNDTKVTSCAGKWTSFWPTRSEEGNHFQEQNLSDESLFCCLWLKTRTEIERTKFRDTATSPLVPTPLPSTSSKTHSASRLCIQSPQEVTSDCTLRAPLSGTFLQTLPDLVTPLKGALFISDSCPPTRSAPSERFGYW